MDSFLFFDGPNCPENAGPNYDFGQGPVLFTEEQEAIKENCLGLAKKAESIGR